jgi:hypothetical protein
MRGRSKKLKDVLPKLGQIMAKVVMKTQTEMKKRESAKQNRFTNSLSLLQPHRHD